MVSPSFEKGVQCTVGRDAAAFETVSGSMRVRHLTPAQRVEMQLVDMRALEKSAG